MLTVNTHEPAAGLAWLNPGTREPGFGCRQTRKPGVLKKPPGLHSLHPKVWPRYTNVTDRQDRQTGQRFRNIGRTFTCNGRAIPALVVWYIIKIYYYFWLFFIMQLITYLSRRSLVPCVHGGGNFRCLSLFIFVGATVDINLAESSSVCYL